jgi:hypothetical protein
MFEQNYWADCAEAMELAVEGNRLIMQDLAAGSRRLWQRFTEWLDRGRHSPHRPHLPPV